MSTDRELEIQIAAHAICSGERAELREQLASVVAQRDALRARCDALEAQAGALVSFVQELDAPCNDSRCRMKTLCPSHGVALAHALAATEEPTKAREVAERLERAEREHIKRLILGGSFFHLDAPDAQWAREVVAAIDRDAEKRARAALAPEAGEPLRCGDYWEGWWCSLPAGHAGDHHDGPATWQAGTAEAVKEGAK